MKHPESSNGMSDLKHCLRLTVPLASIVFGLLALLALPPGAPQAAKRPPIPSDVYQRACANCHGSDGRGNEPSMLAFATPLPDFSDCNFATREPAADWVAVAHQGGPVRGFARMMPSLGEALSVAELEAALDHIRTFCGDESWPRGESNLHAPK